MSSKVDLSSFGNFAQEEASKLQEQIKTERSFVADTLMEELPPATPIDTGEAREGWEKVEEGEVVIVQNLVPHIVYLNDGWSKQAPSGYVDNIVEDVSQRPAPPAA